MRTHLAFLLHMHQPFYVDPTSGAAMLPWVRLHGARAYLDVARLLDEYSEVRLTVNFVPSLIEQLQAVAAGARDVWEELASRPASDWTPADRAYLIERFFSIAWQPNVESRPRYRELLDKRGRRVTPESLQRATATFSDGDLRDLTVLFHLGWLGFAAREGDTTLAELERKGRGYDERDLAYVLQVGRDASARVLSLYRKLADRGQIELSASPYYHPIVPLLCDTDTARRARPDLPVPERFAFADDGRRQIARGRDCSARAFGREPTGMWPPEGSISPEAVAAYRGEGISWLASDEGNLFRSLPASMSGAGRGSLYRPYRFDGVDLVFRDREISDRIGFRYAHGDARAGVDDLITRVRNAGMAGRDAGCPEPLVSIILDGENPWEHYPGSGEPFLRALFQSLTDLGRTGEIVSTGIGPYLHEHRERIELGRLHSGSWIDSDFHIWIGDPVKNRAWELLGHARRRFQRALDARAIGGSGPVVDDKRLEEARRNLEAAEGSDWFWWFGEPFHSAEDALFDKLFRSYLAAAYRALGEVPPDDLDEPVARGTAPPPVRWPRARISPSIDGRIGSYFEWMGAGRYDIPRGAAMADTPIAGALHFGFDQVCFYMRLDPASGTGGGQSAARLSRCTIELWARTSRCDRRFIARPGHFGFELAPGDQPPGDDKLEPAPPPEEARTLLGRLAAGDVFELAFPWVAVQAQPGERVEVALRIREDDVVLLRVPNDGHLELRVPDEHFDAEHWML